MDRIGQKKKLITFSAEEIQTKGQEILSRMLWGIVPWEDSDENLFLLTLCQELRLAEHGWCRHGKDKEKCEECK